MSEPTITQDAITARNSIESPLLRLPAELRLRIWDYASGGHIIGKLPEGKYCFCSPLKLDWIICPFTDTLPAASRAIARKHNNPPPLPATTACTQGLASGICRAIRSETRHMHMRENIFHVECLCNYSDIVANLPRELVREIRDVSLGGCFLLLFGRFLEEHGWTIARDFPNLRRIFIDPRIYQGDTEATLGSIRDLINERTKGKLAGVEMILLDVMNRNQEIAKAEKMTL